MTGEWQCMIFWNPIGRVPLIISLGQVHILRILDVRSRDWDILVDDNRRSLRYADMRDQ